VGKEEIVKGIIIDSGGIARTAQFNHAGIHNYELTTMFNHGFLTRVRHGYYRLADQNDLSEEQMISVFFPEGIICMDSALFHYGYSDRTPLEWTIAVPRSVTASKLRMDLFPYRLYFVQNKYLNLGKTAADFNGTTISVYDRERTICDCFRYRTKLDSEMFNKAIKAYVADERKNLSILSSYAKEMQLFRRINDLLGVLLND
jgi:predicted transcriptional regulator of viral defense system